MTGLRRVVSFSEEPRVLASQVGELARDVDVSLGVTTTFHTWEGPVLLGKGFRVDMGAGRPVEVRVVAVEDLTDRSFLTPGGVQWSWQGGQVQIDETAIGFAAGSIYRVTFLATRMGT